MTTVVVTIASCPLSAIELLATTFGLISVLLAARSHIWTWPTGILNEIGLFILFFQVQLYADMFLQVFFLLVTIYGWYYWYQPDHQKAVNTLMPGTRLFVFGATAALTIALGAVMARLHIWLPAIFVLAAESPYIDSFVTAASIFATFLLARKTLESWLLWIAVDTVSVGLFLSRGVYFLAAEYVIFLIMAGYGYWHWRRQLV